MYKSGQIQKVAFGLDITAHERYLCGWMIVIVFVEINFYNALYLFANQWFCYFKRFTMILLQISPVYCIYLCYIY